MYPKMLQFTPVVQETYAMTLTRNAFLPLVGSVSCGRIIRLSIHRSSHAEVTKSLSVHALKSEMTQRSSEILEAF
jgi:hypothetical protein